MSEFVIVSDSAADLSQQKVDELDVKIIPLSFDLSGEIRYDWPDGREMDSKTFYDRLRAGEKATTAAVNVAQYVDALEPHLQQGLDVLLLVFSSGLSTTYNSACIAAEELSEKYPERTIRVSDTLCASLGQGLLVTLAARRRAAGESLDAVFDWVEQNKLHLCHQFTVADLHFLKRGGRISATTAVLGTMLSIKPVLHVDDEGHLIKIGTVRGRGASLRALVDNMEKTFVGGADQTVFISHGDCLEDAQAVADMVRARFGVKDIYINPVGPVIGAHSGPGTVALFHLGTHR